MPILFLFLAGALAYLTWGTFHWFWSLTFASCAASAMLSLAIRIVRRPDAVARQFMALLKQEVPKDVVKVWISENGLV
jgi:hypothetical protein